jgi:integrase
MVRLQLRTGARSGEIVVMRACDIDMTGEVWFYRPAQHKTAHHGHRREIAIGPIAQEIVKEFLKPDTTAYLFSPRDAVAERRTILRMKRKTKVQPSQKDRALPDPQRTANERYTVTSYGRAIARACENHGIPHWHPHQLRHTAATKFRKKLGLDTTRALLGHRSPAITEIYAELDTGKAAEAAAKLG